MDINTLNPEQDFEELPESYVIFITRDDILGYGLPIYHIDRQIKELNEAFQDEAHIIYVNSRKQDDTELGKLHLILWFAGQCGKWEVHIQEYRPW